MYAFPESLVVWMPALLVAGLGLCLVPLLDRASTLHRCLLAAIAILLSVRYLWWRATDTLAPAGLDFDMLASWSFFVIEAFAVVSSISALAILSRYRDRSPEADANAGWWGDRPPSVAVFIATYNEEWAVLERTIAGALASPYENRRIYVLDDGRREWLGEKCREMGVIHLTRPDNAHGKAGNVNHALALLRDSGSPPDFIAVLDADFVPHLAFIPRVLALFRDQAVGLVQTPQHFFNPDPIQHNLGVSRAYPDEQRFFFDHLQPSRDAWGIAVCCGTSSMVRWDALESIGGFPTDSVTEDYLLTVRLQERGYATAYLNEALSEGLAPEGLKEYITQRARWGLGLMQIVRGPSGPLSRSGLRLRDRWSLLDSMLFWLTIFPFKIACVVYPLLYWYFGVIVLNAPFEDIVWHFAPYYVASMIFMNFVSRGLLVPVIHDVSQIVGAFEITRGVWGGFFQPHGHKFKVTMKGGDRSQTVIQWPILRRFLLLALLTLGGLSIGILSPDSFDGEAGDGKAVILFWTLYNFVMLCAVMMVCVELPRTAAVLRRSPERVVVDAGDGPMRVWLADLNQDSLRLRGIDFRPGTRFHIELPEVGRIDAVATRSIGGTTDAELRADQAARQRLLEKIHTHAGEPGTGIVATAELLSGLLRRTLSGGPR